MITYCNRDHPAIAFETADCPVCITRAAPGVTLGCTSVEVLKQSLAQANARLSLKYILDRYEETHGRKFEDPGTPAGFWSKLWWFVRNLT